MPDAVRFAVASFVFYKIEPKLPDDLPFYLDHLLAFASAIAAYLITALVLELIFGRPYIDVTWTVGGQMVRSQSTTLDFHPTGKQYLIAVNLEFSGGTALSEYVKWRSLSRYVKMQIVMSPADHLYYVSARFPGGVSSSQNGVFDIEFRHGLMSGPIMKFEFWASERILPQGTSTLRCHVKCPKNINALYALALLGKRSELTEFELRK